MTISILDAAWRPLRSSWTEDLKSLGTQDLTQAWNALTGLADTRMDALATLQLDRRLTALFGNAPPPGLSTKPVRLAVLASSNIDHLLPGLRAGALRRGLWLSAYACAYGQYAAELMDSSSDLYAFHPTTVLFALDGEHLLRGFEPDQTADAVAGRLKGLFADIKAHWRRAQEAFGAKVVQQTVLPVFPILFGNNEHRLPGSRRALVDRINAWLRETADHEGIDLLSIDFRIAEDGLRAWHDPALWYHAKQEIHPSAAPLYGDLLARLLAAHQGRSRKCLVLDLDNTLWGGVIGDDGLEGIVLGQGSALGEAYVAFQRYLRSLSRRGVILAVSSKNDEANALEAFDKHPEMVLRREDIACFIANWSDKASNIREIAARLNIGLDAMVFADDNPFERNLVRHKLPMVAVPELPEDPAFYASCLSDAGYFEGLHLTADDLLRTRSYRENAAREQLKSSAAGIDSYLQSMDMELQWSRFNRAGLQRAVQLINKTNQFNLTTRRTTEAAVTEIMGDPRALTLQIRLTDQFGDNGMIAIVIGRLQDSSQDMLIDTWLMSCRVLGRQVEQATLNVLAAEASRMGAWRLIGEYIPTAKNAMVAGVYARLGFEPLGDQNGGGTKWSLPLDGFSPLPTFIRTVEV